MQLEPYHPGKLAPSRRNLALVVDRVTAVGALTLGALAVGSALARLARLRAPEVTEPATHHEVTEPATHHVDAPGVDKPAVRHVYRVTEQAARRIDAFATPGLRLTSVSVWMAERWISRADE